MGVNFEFAIRAEFATQHIMHERKLSGPLDLMLHLGYDLLLENPEKWEAIQKLYELEIARCLKRKCGNRRGFKFKVLKAF